MWLKRRGFRAMKLKVALIGAGGIGDSHLEAIAGLENMEAVAIADIHPARADERARRYGVRPFTDYRLMIEETRPDVAIVALPHFLHKEAAVYCAERGCHLLLEKPMAVAARECDEINEAAERGGIAVLVGHTQQYLAYNLAAKALIARSDLGKPVTINDVRHGPYFTPDRPAWFLDKAKSGGGIVANLGAHAIDKIQWLTDSRIVRVRASLSFLNSAYPDIEGSAAMLLETSEGVPCTVNLSGYAGAARREETELVFERGMIKITNHHSLCISKDGQYEEVAVDRDVHPFQLQLQDLASCIRERRQPYSGGEYGRSVVRVIEAVYRSAAEDRDIVLD